MTPASGTLWDGDFALAILPRLLDAFTVTLAAVAGGMALALTAGLLLTLARRSAFRLLALPSGALVQFVRSTPLLMQLYFLYYVLLDDLGLKWSPLITGIIGLGLYYASYLSEVYRAGIEGVPRGQWDAARALGLSRWGTYRHVILPQAITSMLPAIGNYLIAMFKDTPLLSAITVMEVLRQAKLIGKETFRYLEPITLVGLLYLTASMLCGLFVRRLESRLGAAGRS